MSQLIDDLGFLLILLLNFFIFSDHLIINTLHFLLFIFNQLQGLVLHFLHLHHFKLEKSGSLFFIHLLGFLGLLLFSLFFFQNFLQQFFLHFLLSKLMLNTFKGIFLSLNESFCFFELFLFQQ